MTGLFDLAGTVALVTGATKGIGRGIVERLAEYGAKVVVSARNADECAAAAAALNERYGKGESIAAGIAADLADLASLQRLADGAIALWGRVDTLVANAAVLGFHGPSADTPYEHFEAGLRANVHHNFRLCQMLLPQMKARRAGSIVFITSTAGLVATPEVAAYGVQKAAVNHMARTLAAELAPFNIRVNAVSPGLIRSEASRPIWESPALLAANTRGIPLKRMGKPDNVAAAVLFLAGRGGDFVTGNVIAVDGGSAHLPAMANEALVDAFAGQRIPS